MKTVGEVLKETRQKKGLSLAEVEKATKIRERFLESLEKNDFRPFSEATVVRGFIKNYADFLGLNSGDLLAIFRRDFIESEKGEILPRGIYEPLNRPKLSWSPRLTIISGMVVLFLAFFLFLAFQFSGVLGVPSLEISQPQEGENSSVSESLVSGKTVSDATLTINGEMVLVLPDGSFEKKVSLLPGKNTLVVEATSRRGKKKIIERVVYYNP